MAEKQGRQGLLGAEINGLPVAFILTDRESECSFDQCPNGARYLVFVPYHPEYPSAMICLKHVQAIRNGEVEMKENS